MVKECKVCKKEFTPHGSHVTCSKKCSIENRRQSHRNSWHRNKPDRYTEWLRLRLWRIKTKLLKEHKMEVMVEIEIYKLGCVYRNTDKTWGVKEYTFSSQEEYFKGDLVTVLDANGYSIVKVVWCEKGSVGNHKSVVNLQDVNAVNRAENRKQEIAGQIREAVIRNIESNAFDSLVKQYPDMAPMIEEYKASGGSYSDIMPSIVNMLK